MPKTTTAEASRRQQYELAWQEHWIYRQLFKFYGTAYLGAKSPRPPWEPPVFEPGMRSIVARADREWAAITGLPPLDACNPATWWTAATAAGMQGLPVPNVRGLSVRALGEIILPWALAKLAAAEPAAAEWCARPEGLVSASDLGKELALGEKATKALGNRLARWRKNHAGGWMEVDPSEREARGPKILYRRDAIRPVIDKRRQKKT